jgi:PAS domain S-box-containing protein
LQSHHISMHAPNHKFKIRTTMASMQGDFLLQNLLENTPDIIYFKDLESRFILINQAAAKLFKLKSPNEAIGKTDFDIFTEEHAGAAFADEQEIIRTGNPIVDKEEKETWADGTISWVSTTKMPLRNREGEIIGTFGISRNITDRMHAIEKNAEQAALIDIAPDAIIVCNLQAQILFWNKGAEQIYGWTSQEALGRTPANILFPKEGRAKDDEILRTVLNQGTWKGEIRQLTKDNKKLVIQSHQTLVRDAEDRPKSIFIINTDITEKKKIEAQFMRAQRMESIGVLAGGIAHDLNNILAPILMSIGLLKISARETEVRIIDTLETSAQRGADIVRQVLSFSRGMEGGHTDIQLKYLFKEIGQIVKDTFPKNIEFHIAIPQDLWTIAGDLTQLHQVLLNLCVNARDAMPNGGHITITAENRCLDEHYAVINRKAEVGPYVVLSVADNGMGIEPDILDKIFEPFFTTKESGKGTGLGLSTTMGIVKSHGGFLTVYSDPGKGTAFHVHLPAKISSEAIPQQSQAEGLPRGNGETILVVDDENSILSIASEILLAFGYKVQTAVNGARAVAIYQQNQKEIAAIVTDMAMPIMDGLSAINAIKRINPNVKVIAASGLLDESSMARAAHAGIKYFLHKPYSTENFLKTLQEMLNEPVTFCAA